MSTRNYSSTAAQTTLASGVDASATTLSVSATTGFPAVPFIIAVDAGAAGQELVLVTNVAGTNLTVTRGYDSTVAVSHDAGAVVSHSHGAIDFREANSHVNASTGVHGASGAVVGTTDTQTLTNKTLTAPTITSPTVSGSLAGLGGAWAAYTPSWSGATIGNGTITGAWVQVGKTVQFRVEILVGSSTVIPSGSNAISLPAATKAGTKPSFAGEVFDASAGGSIPLRTTFSTATTSVLLVPDATAGGYDRPLTNSIPFSWAAGDRIYVAGTYEAA